MKKVDLVKINSIVPPLNDKELEDFLCGHIPYKECESAAKWPCKICRLFANLDAALRSLEVEKITHSLTRKTLNAERLYLESCLL